MSSSMYTSTSDDEISVEDYDYPGTLRSFSPAPPSFPTYSVGPNGPINCGGPHPAQSWSYHNPNLIPSPIPSPETNLHELEITTIGLLGDYYALRDRVEAIEGRQVDYKWKIATFVTLGVAVTAIVAAFVGR